MFWLTIHMWVLLLSAYSLGIFSCWLLFRKPAQEPAYEGVRVYDNDHLEPETSQTHRKSDENASADHHGGDDSLGDLPDLDALPDHQGDDASDHAPPANASTPKLFSAPMQGPADDLKRIRGIGPTLERSLNAIGIYYFEQVAAWTQEEIAWVDNRIDFPGRVERERWVAQASVLAAPEESAEPAAEPIEEAPVREAEKPKDIETLNPKAPDPDPVKPATDVPESMLDKLMADRRRADAERK